MTILQKNHVRAGLLAVAAALALGAAPLALARHHAGFGISIGGPGFGIGYSSCSHCRGGYLNGYVAPLYGGYYAPRVYDPYYYDEAYAYPSYNSYPPSYGAFYYDRPA
ncbi:MAG: hypothetical protein WBW61_03755, partial [Rhodanobacteraceae bacterium]